MSSQDSSWSTGSLSAHLAALSSADVPPPPASRRHQPSQLALANHGPNLSPFPPPTPSGSISDATPVPSDVSAMLQQTTALLTPAPSPRSSSTTRIWEDDGGLGRVVGRQDVDEAELRDGLRALWGNGGRGDSAKGRVAGSVAFDLGGLLSLSSQPEANCYFPLTTHPSPYIRSTDPQSLIDSFHAFSPAQRFAFLSLLVPSLKLNEALVISRKIEPRLKRDFLKDLPGELALHCLSFITDAHTLTQAAQVSQHWYSLLQDEQTWKDMCEWHRFKPIITPLSSRRPSMSRAVVAPAPPAPIWSPGQSIWKGDVGVGLGVRGLAVPPAGAAAAVLGPICLGAVAAPTTAGPSSPSYYVPQSIPLGPHPSLRGFGRQESGFKAQFRDAYQTLRNWLHGGRVLKQFIAVAEDDGVVTSLAINNHYMIVGMANSRIHIFDAPTARFRCSLPGHERGVWTLVLVSPAVPEPGDDDYTAGASTSSSRYGDGSTRHDIPHPSGSNFGRPHRRPSASPAYRDDGLSRRASTGAGVNGWGTPPTQNESAYTYTPPPIGFDPASVPDTTLPTGGGSRYAFGPPPYASTFTAHYPPLPTSSSYGLHRSNTSSASGTQYTRGPKGSATPIHPAKRMRSSDICGSARGWSASGMGSRHLVASGGCDRRVKVWDVATGQCIHSLAGHDSTIRCLKVLDRRPIAISGSRDKSLRVWDIDKGVLLRQLVGHTGSVRCVEIAGNMAVSGSYDNTARVWNVDTGECVHVLHGHYHQIYSCAFDGERIITGSLDATVRVWSAATGECIALLQGHTSLVGQLQLIGNRLLTGGSDGRVIVFDLSTYDCLHRLCAHDNSVTCLQFDDRFIISGGMDGRVKLWDISSGAFIRELTKPCSSIWRIACRDDRVVILAQRETRTVLEVLTFRPGEVMGRTLVL